MSKCPLALTILNFPAVYPVVEEEDTETVTGDDGEQIVVPKLFSPNGDFDNLYLDMNGIVRLSNVPLFLRF